MKRRPTFRAYVLMLCGLYLFVVFVFHSHLQFTVFHHQKEFDDLEEDGNIHIAAGEQERGGHPRAPPDPLNFQFDEKQNHKQNPRHISDHIRAVETYMKNFADQDAMDEHADKQINSADPDPLPNHKKQKIFNNITNTAKKNDFIFCEGKKPNKIFDFQEIANNLFMFSAFWDDRPNDFDNKDEGRMLRIITLTKRTDRFELYCAFQIGSLYEYRPLTYYEMCENHNKKFGGFILSCKIPHNLEKVPCSVAITRDNSNSSTINSPRIPVFQISEQDNPHEFAMCVPPLFGKVNLPKLIEWIELSKMLGVEHFTFYHYEITVGVQRVLDYYSKKGLISVVPWPLPESTLKLIWYYGQSLSIQDCMYRHMGRAKFVAFSDIDEFIIPRSTNTWSNMVDTIDQPSACGFQFKSAFFDPNQVADNVSPGPYSHLFSMIYEQRTEMISKHRTKCIIKPKLVFEKGIHHISKPVFASLTTVQVEPSTALIHHYRTCAGNYGQNCKKYVSDTSVRKYAADLHRKVKNVVGILGL